MTTKKPSKKSKMGTSKVSAEDKKRLFVEAYLSNGGNLTEAARTVGYSEGGAAKAGYRMSKDALVLSILAERKTKVLDDAMANTGLTVERTMREIARLTYSDIGKIIGPEGKVLLPHELDADTRAAVASFKIDEYGRIEYKFWDKNSASDKAAKILDMYSPEKVEHSGEVTQITRRLIDA